jgi:tetratricopeptide (TPR) repeat protein
MLSTMATTEAAGPPDVEAAAEQAMAAAEEAFGRFDVEAMATHLSAAARGFTAAGLPCRAAIASARLGHVYADGMGNISAGRAWYTRAQRLVADEPPCVEQGWVAVAAMGCDVDDPAALLAAADLALDRARRFDDVNLEVKALADGGLALVQIGRVSDGMTRLDEAMALVCGPADDMETAARSACSFFTACYRAADYGRADTWAGLLRRRGLIGVQTGGPAFLYGHCNSVQAALLRELGRWSEAEALLEQTIAEYRTVMPLPSLHAAAVLADLRTRQGRLAEAEALLLGMDFAFEALLPLARLHLARGDLDLAGAIAGRALRAIRDDRVRAIELLDILVDVELARGDVDAARRHSSDLAERVDGIEDLDVPALRVRAAATTARVLAAAGRVDDAIALLQSAHDLTASQPLPWLRAALLVDLVRLRDATGDAAGARADARAATALLDALDVVVPADDAELLARAGADPSAAGASAAVTTGTATLTRDGRWWDVTWHGTSARIPDTKGLRYLAELVRTPGVERHALDLVDRVEGVEPDGVDRRKLGDAGDVLDATARRAYRHRVEGLRAEIDDLLATGALEQAEARQDELDQLVRELARAFGLGGRARTAGSAAERARLNVTRALRAATARLAEALPGAGEALDRRLRTGLYCAYEPGDGDIRWIVQS